MARNARTAAKAIAIQQNSAAQAVTRWMFAAAGLAAAIALVGALGLISG